MPSSQGQAPVHLPAPTYRPDTMLGTQGYRLLREGSHPRLRAALPEVATPFSITAPGPLAPWSLGHCSQHTEALFSEVQPASPEDTQCSQGQGSALQGWVIV